MDLESGPEERAFAAEFGRRAAGWGSRWFPEVADAGAMGSAGSGRRRGLTLASLLLAYLILAIAYQRAVPLFEAPDEPSHVLYVALLSSTGELPHTGERRDVPGEGMQPPLYYTALAPLYWAISGRDPRLLDTLHQACLSIYGFADWRGEYAPIRMIEGSARLLSVDPGLDYLRALRWGSLAFGFVAVLCTFAAAHRVSRSTAFAFLCTALFAFSPQLLFVSAYVNNDVACAALGAAAFWLFAVAAERERVPRGGYAAAAVLLALGMATKHSALPALTVCFLALFALDPRPLRARLPDAGFAALLALALAVPTLHTNVERYGDPFGVSAFIESTVSMKSHDIFGGRLAYLLNVYPHQTFRSYWAIFGWMTVVGPDWLYLGFFTLCGLGGLGFLLGWRRERRALAAVPPADPAARSELRRSRALRRYVLAASLATLAAHLWANSQTIAYQGRHLFGAAPPIAALLALGISSLGSGRVFAVRWRTAGAVAAGMAAMALYCLTRMIIPTYR